MGRNRMTEEKRHAKVPDKPTGIAPGAVDYPGKEPPGDAQAEGAELQDERIPRDGVEPSGRPGANA